MLKILNWTIFLVFILAITLVELAPTEKKVELKVLRLISQSNECAHDVERLCNKVSSNDDLALFNCLQDNDDIIKSISKNCQHFLWQYKRNLTTSGFLDKMTTSFCGDELKQLPDCKSIDIGHKVPCLLDNKGAIKSRRCITYLNEIGVFIFSDYHLIYKFVERCKSEIKSLQCGRITRPRTTAEEDEDSETPPENLADYITSQADTLDCVMSNFRNVSKICQHEILRIAELQADDYHLNRPLYLACREDRENLCADVKAGEGRVYSCLMKHKMSKEMSEACQEQLSRKQQIESVDAKADYSLFHECSADIEKYKCQVKDGENMLFLMSSVINCLANVHAENKHIEPRCIAQLKERRREMLEDYRLSPEIVLECKEDVIAKCSANENHRTDEIVQCIIGLAQATEEYPHGQLKKECRLSVLNMLKQVNPTEDLELYDPLMMKACGSTIQQLCRDVAEHHHQTFQCLLRNLDNDQMVDTCREKIQSLMFFISLDINLNNDVVEACTPDAHKYCTVKAETKDKYNTHMVNTLEYHCLWELYKSDRINLNMAEERKIKLKKSELKLHASCRNEMFVLFQAQASKIELDPVVFEPCFDDLAKLCTGKEYHGKRHKCLQDNFNYLSKTCKEAVVNYSEMEHADARINKLFRQACTATAAKLCKGITQPGQIVLCLIENKHSEYMPDMCRSAIEHLQIVSLNEYKISQEFVEHCKQDIPKICAHLINSKEKGTVTRYDVVSCLSEALLTSYVKHQPSPLTESCRKQMSFELLQRSDNIKLDPKLAKRCKNDITKFCTQVSTDQISHCLREHQDELEDDCHRMIFKRERLESFNEAGFDGPFVKACKGMVQQLCSEVPKKQIFDCLHQHMIQPRDDDFEFDSECRKEVILRLQRRHNDIRLNPQMMQDCKADVEKYCNIRDLDNIDAESGQVEMQGNIISCLRKVFANNTRALEPKCKPHVLRIIIEANNFFSLDRPLRRACFEEIKSLCANELQQSSDGHGAVHNCLKHKFLKRQITNQKCQNEVHRILRESGADIHVDYELYSVCDEAIIKFCNVHHIGQGRIITCLVDTFNVELSDFEKLKDRTNKKFHSKLGDACASMIRDRGEMWASVQNNLGESSGNLPHVQSLRQLYDQVATSSTRIYLMSMLAIMVMILVLLGVCCGRVTKRVPVDVKNK